MTTHLITDPAATAATLDAIIDAAWWGLSAAMTDEVPVIADRDDLLVTVAPGAGRGAPACFLPALATIEVNGAHLGAVDPATARPHLNADRARYAAVWGLLTHECAHAQHSRWEPPPDAPPGAVAAAHLLEEARIEACQISRRPDDRHWLRASATELILNDTRAADAAHGPAMTPAAAAQAAALLLARADAGILTTAEVAPVAATVTAILGTDTLARLRAVWQAARKVADHDAAAMIELGRQWCEIIGTDPDTPTEPTTPAAPGGQATGEPSPLARAVVQALGAVAVAVAREAAPEDPGAAKAAAQQAQDRARARAVKIAAKVFNETPPGTPPDTTSDTPPWASGVTGTRQPTAQERSAARVLGRALSTAGVRERAAVKTNSAFPPGRLRMRGALAADAQRAAGALPTAEPFTRTTRTMTPSPPLRLGIACDVSGSMAAFAGPVASAAWILAHAAAHAQVCATTATVTFGRQVQPITYPATAPRLVSEFRARDLWEAVDTAIEALDGALNLAGPGAARLLVIVSDGGFRAVPRRKGQAQLDRLRAAGCAVLWLAPDPDDARPLRGATVHALTDPAATARTIGHAAITALRTNH